jgi:hypothetical protein
MLFLNLMPWRSKNRRPNQSPPFVDAHRAGGAGSLPVLVRAPAQPTQATIPHASSTTTGSDPCWIWLQSCPSPASASPSGSPSNPQSQTVLPPLTLPRRPQQPGSLELADRWNTPFPASSVREGNRILFEALCESLRFTESGKCLVHTFLWRDRRHLVRERLQMHRP